MAGSAHELTTGFPTGRSGSNPSQGEPGADRLLPRLHRDPVPAAAAPHPHRGRPARARRRRRRGIPAGRRRPPLRGPCHHLQDPRPRPARVRQDRRQGAPRRHPVGRRSTRLAGELAAAGGDHRVAFPAYEREMREFVRLNQQLGIDQAKQIVPADRARVWLQLAITRLLPFMPGTQRHGGDHEAGPGGRQRPHAQAVRGPSRRGAGVAERRRPIVRRTSARFLAVLSQVGRRSTRLAGAPATTSPRSRSLAAT